MTIISVVSASDGIVMAADSRVTLTEHFPDGRVVKSIERDNEFKISHFKKRNIGISYTGDTHIKNRSVTCVLKEFQDKHFKESDTIEDISRRLHEYLVVESVENTCFYVCGYDDDKPSIFLACRDAYIKKSPYSAYWHGDHTAVSRCLTNVDITFEKLSLEKAIEFSEIVVKTAIEKEVVQGNHYPCGGPIDVLIVKQGNSYFHRLKTIR